MSVPGSSTYSADRSTISFVPTSSSVPRVATDSAGDSLRLTIGLSAGIPLLLVVVVMAMMVTFAFVYCTRMLQSPSLPLDDKMWRRKEMMAMDPHPMNVEEGEVEKGEEKEEADERGEQLTNDNGGIELKEKRNPKRFACCQPMILDADDRYVL
ncbi:hypothetical protein EMCRGX_G029421 [Ephydatia muelleri]